MRQKKQKNENMRISKKLLEYEYYLNTFFKNEYYFT